MSTGAVLIRHTGTPSEQVTNILDRIEGYMMAQKFVYMAFNCEEEHLETMSKIAPGKRAPTVQHLKDGNKQNNLTNYKTKPKIQKTF